MTKRIYAEKNCLECGRIFTRRRDRSKLEMMCVFRERKYCSHACAAKGMGKARARPFWSFADVRNDDECWIWTGAINKSGYGSYRSKSAHRVAYEVTYGPIPPSEGYHGTVVRHTCDCRTCVNPKHLILGTQRQNCEDRDLRGRVVNRRRGESNHASRFTEQEVMKIKSMIADGKSINFLSNHFNCSRGAIVAIRRGRTWAWVGQAAVERAVA